ncbi:MAG TPA: DUF4167 domain-containing protein [Pseudolabrys sp.]|jgi:hypothetical protein|nr:DUF4167 domain-containing protein [Pseudolabrys sp.]
MRNGQKRMRGRGNHRKSQNPLTRVYESNGPDVKIRGTASHVAEKYIQLARDAQSSGDPVAAENYYQHAEHYFRLIAAAQEQFRQQNPYYQQQQGGGAPQGAADDNYDDDGDDQPNFMGQNEPSFVPREPQAQAQPYLPRDAQPFPPRDQQQPRQQQPYAQQQQQPSGETDMGGLPAFITGSGGPQPQQNGGGQNGHDQGDRGDRFGGHHRRRRRRGGGGGGGFRPERADFGSQPGNDGGDGAE